MDESDSVIVPEGVVIQTVGDEAVILNLNTEHYYGLDDVGTRMWQVLTEAATIGQAVDILHAEYDVERERLRADLLAFVTHLRDQSLIVIESSR